MNIQTNFKFDDVEIQRLLTVAISIGFMRENPRRKWNKKETKEACKIAIKYLVKSNLNK